MRLVERIAVNINDVRYFGPAFVLRHLGRLAKDRIARVSVPGVGPVHLRAGESDVAAIRQIFGKRDYDISWPFEVGARIRARYEAILASGGKPIIVDAGANIGAASLWFGQVYPNAAIVAVEPDPGNAAVLRRNVGGRPGHVVLEAAIGAEPGHVILSSGEADMGWAVQTTRAESGLPIVTVQDAYKASGGDAPFIVKIDIEGFERDLFSSNLGWLDDCYMVIIEPHDWMLPGQLSSRSFQQAMAQHPFELFMRGENIFYVRV